MNLPKCDVCGEAVSVKNGVLSVSMAEIDRYRDAQDSFRGKHRGEAIVSADEFLQHPRLVQWKWCHSKCVTGSAYEIEAERFDSLPKAMHWTLHLMGKVWFSCTNWRAVVMRLYPGIYKERRFEAIYNQGQ